ncbi:MAG: CpaF family protein [Anaerolineales bacterium]|nr:CpaF family protein [Anaerolineales bacterium]
MTMSGQSPSDQQQSVDVDKLKAYLISNLTQEFENNPPPIKQRRQAAFDMLDEVYKRTNLSLAQSLRAQLFHDVMDDLLGYGPIQSLLDEESVSEVMVNGPYDVYVERSGKLVRTNVKFNDNNHVLQVIDRIILPLGRRVDEDNPTVDARLPDGSRVNAVVPPVAIDGPSITIRKFAKEKLTIQQLVEFGSLTDNMADFLRACVVSRLNIVISGGTGSGKTTLLNILSSFIPSDERIVTIEDAAELQLHQEHIVRLETKPPNVEGLGAVHIRDLVRNSLRMRPDRIIIGEVRGGEALDMLQAMNTGHDGSLTTAHANTPRDALSRLETMALMSGLDMPLKVIREQIASAVDLIVQQSRLKDGSRKVTYITEVAGMEGETVVMTDIFKFEQTSIDDDGKIIGELKPTGIRPLFSDRLIAAGFKLTPQVFGAVSTDKLESSRSSPRRRRR